MKTKFDKADRETVDKWRASLSSLIHRPHPQAAAVPPAKSPRLYAKFDSVGQVIMFDSTNAYNCISRTVIFSSY